MPVTLSGWKTSSSSYGQMIGLPQSTVTKKVKTAVSNRRRIPQKPACERLNEATSYTSLNILQGILQGIMYGLKCH